MSLTVLNMTPVNGSINIQLDSTFMVEFDNPVDPFSIPNGISLYTLSSGTWSGPDLAILDREPLALNTSNDEYLQYQIQFTVEGNRVFIKPLSSLAPEKTHYIAVFPGNDPTKTISELTFGTPTYTRIKTSNGTIEASSSYIGLQDDTFNVIILQQGKISVTKGSVYVGDFDYESGAVTDIGEVSILFNGSFDPGDIITVDVFKAKGLISLFKTSFETSKYDTMTPQSTSLTVPPGNILDQLKVPLKVIKTLPDNMSFNNQKINPITVKFNQPINIDQNIFNKIQIKRTDMLSGDSRYINYYYKINIDTLKIFMISVSK